jgi:putative Holliday junction resolvase
MKYLGIDWGSKNIGIAISDEEGKMAFPNRIIAASPFALEQIALIIKEEGIGTVVVGVPVGTPREQPARDFILKLQKVVSIPVIPQDEGLSTAAMKKLTKEKAGRRTRTKIRKQLVASRDAVSAMLILQDYLDRKVK